MSRGTGADYDEVATPYDGRGAKPPNTPRKYSTGKFVVFNLTLFRRIRSCHSYRKATMGSTRMARRAGR
jgi:hypothetical protein